MIWSRLEDIDDVIVAGQPRKRLSFYAETAEEYERLLFLAKKYGDEGL